MPSSSTTEIAIIGDVHDLWDASDNAVLHRLGADLALFVGDFGNEAISVVRAIAAYDGPMAAILGNHDAWFSATSWGRKKCPYDRAKEDRVNDQMAFLGDRHVGYSYRDFPNCNLSVVGGRPFSWGGPKWSNEEFYRHRYGIDGLDASADRIVKGAIAAEYDTTIFLAHNGPSGLGAAPEDPCGKDWNPIGGDFGDRDLEMAIDRTRQRGKTVPLVTFGHMHYRLRHRSDRLRRPIHVDSAGTVYVNAACVPRIAETKQGKLHHFCWVTLADKRVDRVALRWVSDEGAIVSEEVFYQGN